MPYGLGPPLAFLEGVRNPGFDHRGFDRAGYDVNGYNWRGLNRDGLDRQGIDQERRYAAGLDRLPLHGAYEPFRLTGITNTPCQGH